mgnify:CR=1 FL=1
MASTLSELGANGVGLSEFSTARASSITAFQQPVTERQALDFILVDLIADETIGQPRRIANNDIEFLRRQQKRSGYVFEHIRPNRVAILMNQAIEETQVSQPIRW